MPRPKNSPWNRDNRLAQVEAATRKAQPKRGSWWADPINHNDRQQFQAALKQRHREILNSASGHARSLSKTI